MAEVPQASRNTARRVARTVALFPFYAIGWFVGLVSVPASAIWAAVVVGFTDATLREPPDGEA